MQRTDFSILERNYDGRAFFICRQTFLVRYMQTEFFKWENVDKSNLLFSIKRK